MTSPMVTQIMRQHIRDAVEQARREALEQIAERDVALDKAVLRVAEAALAEAQEMIAVEHSGCEAALKQMEDATALVEIQRAEVERLRAKLAEAQAARDQAQQASGRLMDEVERLRSLLSECLQDYGHPNFTDRHGMADRIRAALRGPGEKT